MNRTNTTTTTTMPGTTGYSTPYRRPPVQLTIVSYNRGANAIENNLPQGKAFILKGYAYPNEHTIRVFYRRRTKEGCPKVNVHTAYCPKAEGGGESKGEEGGGWACQEWQRGRNKKTNEFQVLIPRLRESIAPYCFQVAYYGSLSGHVLDALLSEMLKDLRKEVLRPWFRDITKHGHLKRVLSFNRGLVPTKKEHALVEQIVANFVAKMVRGRLLPYLNLRGSKPKESAEHILRRELTAYATAYLHAASKEQYVRYLSHGALLKPYIKDLLGVLLNDLQNTTNSFIRSSVNRRPHHGTENSRLSGLLHYYSQYKSLNLTLLKRLMNSKPKFTHRFSELLREVCGSVLERGNKLRMGAKKYNQFVQTMKVQLTIPNSTVYKPRWQANYWQAYHNKTVTGSPETRYLSCHRFSKKKILDVNQNFGFRTQQGKMVLAPNLRINVYAVAHYFEEIHHAYKREHFFRKQLHKVEKEIRHTIGSYLSSVNLRASNSSAPIAVGGASFIDYYVSTDIGLAGTMIPGFDSQLGGQIWIPGVLPYIGFHFYFVPVSKDIPLRLEDGFLRRFSIFGGFTLGAFKVQDQSVNAIGLLGATGLLPMVGMGLRLTDFIRVSGGAFLYTNKSLNPFLQHQTGRLAVSGFVSLSIDVNVWQFIGQQLRKIGR